MMEDEEKESWKGQESQCTNLRKGVELREVTNVKGIEMAGEKKRREKNND